MEKKLEMESRWNETMQTSRRNWRHWKELGGLGVTRMTGRNWEEVEGLGGTGSPGRTGGKKSEDREELEGLGRTGRLSWERSRLPLDLPLSPPFTVFQESQEPLVWHDRWNVSQNPFGFISHVRQRNICEGGKRDTPIRSTASLQQFEAHYWLRGDVWRGRSLTKVFPEPIRRGEKASACFVLCAWGNVVIKLQHPHWYAQLPVSCQSWTFPNIVAIEENSLTCHFYTNNAFSVYVCVYFLLSIDSICMCPVSINTL